MLSVARRQPCNLQNAAILPVPCLHPAPSPALRGLPCPPSPCPRLAPLSHLPGLLDPVAPGFCKLGILGQTLGLCWDPNLWLLAAAVGLGAVLCVPGISLILSSKVEAGSKRVHMQHLSVCVRECVSVRLSLKVTGAPTPGGSQLSAPDLSPRQPNKISGSMTASHFTALSFLFPPSVC